MAMLRRVAHPGSLVIIISDFIGLSRAAQSYLTGIARHNEVLAVFLSDPLERQLPPPGRYRLVSHDDEMAIDTYAKRAASTTVTHFRSAFSRWRHSVTATAFT